MYCHVYMYSLSVTIIDAGERGKGAGFCKGWRLAQLEEIDIVCNMCGKS